MSIDGWTTITHCTFCGSDSLAQSRTVTTAPALIVNFCGGSLPVLTSTNYIICGNCGLEMQSPRMSDERIDEYYSSGLYRETLGITTEYMDADEHRRAVDVVRWLKSNNVTADRHLDIGASRGYLLQAFGAKTQHGYDNNPAYAESMVQIQERDKLETYDLVTAVHVLEHVIDPLTDLADWASLTTDRLLIEVPGANCKGSPYRFAHLHYFPPHLLIERIKALGMQIVAIETNPNTRILAQKQKS